MSGFGSIIAFEIAGDEAAAYRVLNQLSLIDISNNLGDSKSLACHPYTTTHSSLSDEELAELGITTSHLRLSVGLESVHDLMRDIEQALSVLG
jgi:O-succinylhomoserine sulfhydrylase